MKEQKVYIGNCSKNGIYYYTFKNGNLKKKYSTNDSKRCTYLKNSKCYLYGVIEIKDEKNKNNGYVMAYKNNKDGLINIDKKSSYGQGPCHINISEKKKLMFVSNYIDGQFVVFRINKDGTIGNKIYSKVLNQKSSHMHCAEITKNSKYLFAVDLGNDSIVAYEIKDKIKEISRIKFMKGTQPRHITINRDIIYVVTEESCKIYIIKFNKGKLRIINNISILPSSVSQKKEYTGCAIKISKNLRYLYVTIRGHNSISVYKVNKEKLKLIQNISCRGNLPRDLEIDKSGRYVLVANQDSNEIAIFIRNNITGKLSYKSKESMKLPTCVILR